MKEQQNQSEEQNGPEQNNQDQKFPGYPHYKPEDDIYRQEEELKDIDPETKKPVKSEEEDNIPGLDVPGTEDDDQLENVGSEDEENNYYSLGGDDHENLEEDKDGYE